MDAIATSSRSATTKLGYSRLQLSYVDGIS